MPKNQKFTQGDRLQNLLSDLLELLIEAYYGPSNERYARLLRVNIQLEKLRFFTRLIFESGYFSSRQYETMIFQYDDIGRMTGAWIKSLK